MALNFADKFALLSEERSNFCLGIDPSKEILTRWGLDDNCRGLSYFLDVIIDLSQEITLVKPQFAFFERLGIDALKLLQKAIEKIKNNKTLILADCKRSDISHSMRAYAETILGENSVYKADAMTAVPYFGIKAMQAAYEHAFETNTAIFVVVRSSNPEGEKLQTAKIDKDNINIALWLAEEINKVNNEFSKAIIGPVSAVIGATLNKKECEYWLQNLPNSLLLTPGIGAQGVNYDEWLDKFFKSKRAIPSASRSILNLGPDIKAIKQEIENAKSNFYL